MFKKTTFFLCFGLTMGLGFLRGNTQTQKSPESHKILTIGAVSNNPQKHYKGLKLMVDYGVHHLKGEGYQAGAVFLAKDHQELMKALQERRVDWITLDPLYAHVYSRKTGAQIILRRWKKGIPQFTNYIFVKAGSEIRSLDQLKGKKIAFEKPDSAEGYLLPLAILRKKGFDLVYLSSPTDIPPSQKIGYVFSGGPLNTSAYVYKGLADAGVLTDFDWEQNESIPAEVKDNFTILEQWQPFDLAVEMVRKDMPAAVKDRIKKMLVQPDGDRWTQYVFDQYDQTSAFEMADALVETHINEIKKLMAYLKPVEILK